MSRRQGSNKLVNESESTFRFDSKANDKYSKSKNDKRIIEYPEIDFNLPTSQVMRHAELRNQNILQLLEDSQEDKKTSKEEKTKRNDLWDFFARFQKQSNPDITISDIQFPVKRENQLQKQRNQNPRKGTQKLLKIEKKEQFEQYIPEEKEIKRRESHERYPKRNRVGTLRYWLGQKCVYRDGKIINVIRPKNEDETKDSMI